jgi:hypothetical protein
MCRSAPIANVPLCRRSGALRGSYRARVELAEGFEIETPAVLVPWGISEATLLALLPAPPRHVTTGYYVIHCTSLSGLEHELGFHFSPKEDGRLVELEFFRQAYADLRGSFDDFQRHLELTFGPPVSTSAGDEDFPTYGWRFGAATVRHYLLNRFGPEEHVRITRS